MKAITRKPSKIAPDTGTHTLGTVHSALDPQLRRAMVAEAAYFLAERRGFTPGREAEDWLAAEDLIARRLGEG